MKLIRYSEHMARANYFIKSQKDIYLGGKENGKKTLYRS